MEMCLLSLKSFGQKSIFHFKFFDDHARKTA